MRRAARLLVRGAAFFLLRISRRLERTGRSVAFATFTAAELDALSVAEWEAFGDLGPAADSGPFSWEAELFATNIRPGDSILVVGAGSGRDVIPLLEAGHSITALDIAPRALEALAEKARARGLKVATVHASIVDIELPQEAFDVVVFSWFCFAYLRGAEGRRSALSRSKAALRKGGRVLLSYPVRRGAGSPASSTTWLSRVAARWLGGIDSEVGDQFNVSGSAIRPSVFFSHSFEPEEIEDEARRAGFTITSHNRSEGGVGVMALARSSEASR